MNKISKKAYCLNYTLQKCPQFSLSTMSRKQLFILGAVALLLVNGSIFGTLYIVDLIRGPSAKELAALEEAEAQAAREAIYAQLPPLEEFKSKANNLQSIGEAISICEDKLHDTVKQRKSWEVSMIESRYKPAVEMYLVIMTYQTIASKESESETYKVACEVSAESKVIDLWKATKRA